MDVYNYTSEPLAGITASWLDAGNVWCSQRSKLLCVFLYINVVRIRNMSGEDDSELWQRLVDEDSIIVVQSPKKQNDLVEAQATCFCLQFRAISPFNIQEIAAVLKSRLNPHPGLCFSSCSSILQSRDFLTARLLIRLILRLYLADYAHRLTYMDTSMQLTFPMWLSFLLIEKYGKSNGNGCFAAVYTCKKFVTLSSDSTRIYRRCVAIN